MMARKCIEKYLETHKSTYIGRYRCHSAVQTKKFEHKFHYYILDIQFKAIDVFVTIDYSGDEIVPTFSVNLHEQEQEYIIKDALNKILYFNQFKTILHCHVFEHFIETHTVDTILEPLDYRNILDYLEYHSGTNQETVDEFYTFFNPYLDRLLYNKNYKKFMDSIALLLDKILYEYEWDGVNAKYLDTEYQFHLEYFKETIKKMTNHIDGFFESTKDELLEIFERLCQMPRFTLSIIKEFGNLILLNKEVAERLFNHFERLNPDQLENNIVISYLKSLYQNNHEQYIDACEDILRFVMNDVLTFANHDLQKEIGNRILEIEGYDLLIDLFSKDYNTFLFVCFPISTFPPEYKEIMRLELEKAIRFYAARMNHDEYRLTSFEQVANINRLLMEEYKEEYSDGKE